MGIYVVIYVVIFSSGDFRCHYVGRCETLGILVVIIWSFLGSLSVRSRGQGLVIISSSFHARPEGGPEALSFSRRFFKRGRRGVWEEAWAGGRKPTIDIGSLRKLTPPMLNTVS